MEIFMSMFMRFPGGRFKTLTLSYDDAVTSDIRLIGIMDKYGLKGTFNISSGFFAKDDGGHYLSKETAKKLYTGSYEPALHTYRHTHITELPEAAAMDEIVRDKQNLEQMFGRIITGGAYPFGDNDDKIAGMMKLSGIKYCRVVPKTHRFDMPKDWLRLQPTCHHNDPQLTELAEKFAEMKIDKNFRWGTKPQMFYLWGHSYEFNDDDNWEVIERFSEFIGGRDDIWYATNGEICEYAADYSRLEVSSDGSIIKNPTCRDIWFNIDNDEDMIKSGETLVI